MAATEITQQIPWAIDYCFPDPIYIIASYSP